MVRDKAKFKNFCRRWKIADLGGDGTWNNEIKVGDQFVIVRNKKLYRFIPMAAFGGSMVETPLNEDKDAFVTLHDGKPLLNEDKAALVTLHHGETLQGVLWAEFGARTIQFSLSFNAAIDNFEILLDDYAGNSPANKTHGGPHGSDD